MGEVVSINKNLEGYDFSKEADKSYDFSKEIEKNRINQKRLDKERQYSSMPYSRKKK